MDATTESRHQVGVCEMVAVSLLSGLFLGFLLLCFMRPLAGIFGDLPHDLGGFVRRGVSAGLIGLFALLPTIAVLWRRSDLTAFLLSGPQVALWAIVMFYVGGVGRWGKPPEVAWPLAGCYVIYVVFLSAVVLIFVKRRST